VVRDANLGRRYADKLVRVWLNSGEEKWVLVHIEIQGQRDTDLAERMFVYNYRCYDRFKQPVASLAVLADESAEWQTKQLQLRILGFGNKHSFSCGQADRLSESNWNAGNIEQSLIMNAIFTSCSIEEIRQLVGGKHGTA